MDAVELELAIPNYKYEDLSKEFCPAANAEQVEKLRATLRQKLMTADGLAESPEEKEPRAESVVDVLGKAVGKVVDTHQRVMKNVVMDPENTVRTVAQGIDNTTRVVRRSAKKIGKEVDGFVDGVVHADDKAVEGAMTRTGLNDKQVLDEHQAKQSAKAVPVQPAFFQQMPGGAPAPASADPANAPCATIEEMLTTVLKETVTFVISYYGDTEFGAPAPAPGLPTISLLRGSTSKRRRQPMFDISVSYHPGEAHTSATGASLGRSLLVTVIVSDFSEAYDPAQVLQSKIMDGTLASSLENAMYETTGLHPKFATMTAKHEKFDQWPIDNCTTHLAGIVKMFSLAYTREEVPMAIYNECTNFMPKLSFSSDLSIGQNDKKRCRQATLEFAKQWNYGKSKVPVKNLLGGFCGNVCKLKYGEHHPSCGSRGMPSPAPAPQMA